MVSVVFLIQSLLLCLSSRGVVSQQLQPNGTLFIPAFDQVAALATDEVIIASAITTIDSESATEFAIIDARPTVSNTLTLELSPTGASIHGSDSDLGVNNLKADLNVTCTISAGIADCNLSVAVEEKGVTLTPTSSITENTSGVPVVALNFGPTTTTSPPAAGPTNAPPAQTNSALVTQASVVSIMAVAFGLLAMM